MTTETETSRNITDRVFTHLLGRDVDALKQALAAKDYPKARRWAKELAKTVRHLNANLEARGV